ncbi:hypothetical protein HK103_007553 [Boothiomyces macroporosus]|uniref:Uncharacterized protein n=1 Tax=Boothiomyces macroporosus TaxID=261099 RepID=A0AAD5UGA8_9FUNG|nr:hypothetical protein HK103_007553 [Boothiomyces macroporosus]
MNANAGEEWWNLSIVEEAKRKLQSKDYLVIMMIEFVDLYDDRKGHVHKFKLFLDSQSLPNNVHHVIIPKHEELHMPLDLEKELVFDLIQICNDRINNYRRTQSQKSLSRNTLSSLSIKEEVKVSFGEDITTTEDPVESKDSIESTSKIEGESNPETRHTRFDSLEGEIDRKSQVNEDYRNSRKSRYTTEKLTSKMGSSCVVDNSDCPPPRRISISMFRKLIELTEEVHYTAVVLDDSSKQKLISEFKCPETWTTKCERMTICYGKADLEAINLFGEEGAPIELEATHVSMTSQAISCKVKTVLPDMHITVHTHLESKPTEFEWKEISPINLRGQLVVKKTIGLKEEKNHKKEQVSIGGLIKKHYPSLTGKEIKKFKEKVQEMMSKSFMENCDSNRANIEYYIKTVDLNNIFT